MMHIPLVMNRLRVQAETLLLRPASRHSISRNVQLSELVKKRPKTLATIKEVEGFGDSFVEKYGKEVLALLANVPAETNEKKSRSNAEI